MSALRVLVSRVLNLFGRRHRDEDLAEDIQLHLDLLTEEHVRRGLPRDEARAAARRAFGGVEQVKEAYRDQRGLPWVDALMTDLRFGVRLLAKDRSFTLVAVIALALGIGANNTVFTILNALTRGLPVEHPHRIVRFNSRDVAGRELRVSSRDFQDWAAATRTCIGLAAFAQTAMTISESDRDVERFSGAYLSANAFQLLGEQPTLGRNFLLEDDQAGARPVVILGYRVWQNRYSGDPEVIGRTVAINGVTSDIVGVMREGFRSPTDTSNVLAMGLALTTEKYATPAKRTMFYENLEDRLARIPMIASAALVSSVPFSRTGERELSIDGRVENQGEKRPTVTYVTIGSRYFETLGLPLVRGRDFTATDGTPGHESAIVNKRFVAMYFEHEDPVGRKIRVTDVNAPGANPAWVTIVGVSPSLRQQQAAELRELDPVVYLPSRAEPRPFATLLVRSQSESGALVSLLREELRAIDPDVPVSGIIPLARLMNQSRWSHRVFGAMLTVFAGIALLLSAIGLYAVTAYAVKQRRQEIGIRMALGARTQQVVRLFVRQTLVPLAVGLAIGAGGAFIIARLLSAFLMQTEPTDPLTWLSGAALLMVVAIAAAFFPARRAARLDPVVVLRHE